MPEAAVLKDLADDIILTGFDERDDFHSAAALRAGQRIDLINPLDEHGPAAAGLAVGR